MSSDNNSNNITNSTTSLGNSSKQTQAEYIIQQINVNNAKKIALLLVIGFILYHGLIHLRYGTDSCKWLLTNGRYKGDKEWQPYGCMMHKYSQIDSRRCFRYLAFWGKENYFVLIGDERMQPIYKALIEHIEHGDDTDANDSSKIHIPTSTANQQRDNKLNDKNLTFIDNKLRLRINYIYHNEVTTGLINELIKYTNDDTTPSTIILGFTYTKLFRGNLTRDMLKAYGKNLTKIVKPLEELATKKKTRVLWKMQDQIVEGSEKLTDEWRNVTNDDIERLNYVAYDTFDYTSIKVWLSSRLISSGLVNEMIDGYQLSPLALRHTIQIILNMYCNDYMNYYDGTCCSSSESYTILQAVTYAILGVCVTLAIAILIRRAYLKFRGTPIYTLLSQGITNTSVTDYTTPIFALATLGLILGYFYLCDRTNFFMKENKYYSEFSFWIPVGYVFALGLFFTEDSRFTKVLHRDQTDELKGWMQLCILIYHMTGADRVLPIYMHIKVLISGYIFLSGYGHFTHVWQTGSTSLIRFFQVMFRLNFMTILLCLCMNRPYQFYYFVPLITFWFCIVYFVLSLPPHITSQNLENNPYHYLYLVLKFIGLMSVITILYMSEVFFERIFVTRPWKALFVTTDDDIRDWWYRWKLDRYTISYGMIFAAFLHIAQKYGIVDDNNHGNLFSRQISLTVTLISIIGIGFYTTFSFLCRNRQNCEEIHSYIVFIPIIGYIVLRNITGILRTRYSAFFSWFGKISLELFICQCHIWLAADHHGVLVLLPGFPSLNVLITSFIFVCASHEIHRVTLLLLPYVVPNDLKTTLRNFILFLVILIPIGRYDETNKSHKNQTTCYDTHKR